MPPRTRSMARSEAQAQAQAQAVQEEAVEEEALDDAARPPHPDDGFNALRFSVAMLGVPRDAANELGGGDGGDGDGGDGDGGGGVDGEVDPPVLLQPLELCFHHDFVPDPDEPLSLHFGSRGAVRLRPPPDLPSPQPPCYICEGGVINLFPSRAEPRRLWDLLFGFVSLALISVAILRPLVSLVCDATRHGPPVVEVVVRELPLHRTLITMAEVPTRFGGSFRSTVKYDHDPQGPGGLATTASLFGRAAHAAVVVGVVAQYHQRAQDRLRGYTPGPMTHEISREAQLISRISREVGYGFGHSEVYWRHLMSWVDEVWPRNNYWLIRTATSLLRTDGLDGTNPRNYHFFASPPGDRRSAEAPTLTKFHSPLSLAPIPPPLPDNVQAVLEVLDFCVSGDVRDDSLYICNFCNRPDRPRPPPRDDSGPIRRGRKRSSPHASTWHFACKPTLVDAMAAAPSDTLLEWAKARRASRVPQFLSTGEMMTDDDFEEEVKALLAADGDEHYLLAVARHLAQLASSLDDFLALLERMDITGARPRRWPLSWWNDRHKVPPLSPEKRDEYLQGIALLKEVREGPIAQHLEVIGAMVSAHMKRCTLRADTQSRISQLKQGKGWVTGGSGNLSIDEAGNMQATVTYTRWVLPEPTAMRRELREAANRLAVGPVGPYVPRIGEH